MARVKRLAAQALIVVFALNSAPAGAQGPSELNVIKAIRLRTDGPLSVEISGTNRPNFTTFSMSDPPRLVVDLSEAVIEKGALEEQLFPGSVVTSIKPANFGSDSSAIARVQITFAKETETDLQTVGGTSLIIRVGNGEGALVAQAGPVKPGPDGVAAPDKAVKEDPQEKKRLAVEEKKKQEEEKRAAAEAARAAERLALEEKKRQDEERRAAVEAARATEAEQARLALEEKKKAERVKRASAEEKKRAEAAAAEEKKRAALEERKRQQDEAEAAKLAARAAEEAQVRAAAEERKRKQEEAQSARLAAKAAEEEQRRAAVEEKKRRQEAASVAALAAKAAEEEQRRTALGERKRKEEEIRAAAEEKKQRRADEAREAKRLAQESREKELAELQGKAAATKEAERQRRETEKAAALAERQRLEEERNATAEAEAEKEKRKALALAERRPSTRVTIPPLPVERLEKIDRTERAEPVEPSSGGPASGHGTVETFGFKQLPGVSRIFVRTTSAVPYRVSEGGHNTIVIELTNTSIGKKNNRRSLDTSFFNSPVAMVSPHEKGKGTVRFEIKLKSSVPYETRQEGQELQVDFVRP